MKKKVKFYSASKGIIKIKDFFLKFSDTVSKGHYDMEFVVDFLYENVEIIVNQDIILVKTVAPPYLSE